MPEGDVILKLARKLHAALAGKELTAARARRPDIDAESLVGRRVTGVTAHGKNLFVDFDDRRRLLTHLRMRGVWHVYGAGEKWRRPEWQAEFVLTVGNVSAVCFQAPLVELLTAFQARGHRALRCLGPDILADELDLDEVVRRLRELAVLPLGEALMRQSAVAGVGNVYKSEVLFVCRLSPFRRVDSLSDEDLGRVVARARELMQKNLGRGSRSTTGRRAPSQRLYVYEKSGLPCPECGEPIRMRRQGDAGRSTYYCERCQPL